MEVHTKFVAFKLSLQPVLSSHEAINFYSLKIVGINMIKVSTFLDRFPTIIKSIVPCEVSHMNGIKRFPK